MNTRIAKQAPSALQQSLRLPCGVEIPNRIAKAAMSEQLADRYGSPTTDLQQLYAAWATGGTGLLITGNVMIDHRAFVEPRNVVLEDEKFLQANQLWAHAAHVNDSKIIMQINHPGRVAVLPLFKKPIAPSAVGLDLPALNIVRIPRAMTEVEIYEQIQRFATTAALAVKAGFDGVQVHSAHGYLLSQFLSPLSNIRNDQWGGNAQNRRRMLIETVKAVRKAIGANKILSVKLNSADFQKGGLTQAESVEIALALEKEGIDLLEISGGNYESPAQLGYMPGRQTQRDAYFLDYARALRTQSKLPLMLTGGLRNVALMNQIIADGTVDLVGLARPFAMQPDIATQLLAGQSVKASQKVPAIGFKPVDAYLQLAWHAAQFRRISQGQRPKAIKGLIKTLCAFGPRMGLNILTQN
ncbi:MULTISPECIES: NADH:flavin oxidoreductase/NADH oxidase family protein [unclassified Acinetobacter]|uniref:NADH:flavin oxidoreductase/NADH oxidase family protein n=1 Tax=unclassified Acinetobacter TaxID=196816 RepID=UPI00190CCFB1|nr:MULTISPECIES: NADH:flavin oxidoreductase/NADH oxidase family protein [unclassified Acinetobacter]MBK0064118.1 NADH:flavin oxidoreductase/NADH oxidase family protein [Acinetobacter sp. S55]MBK0067373.1 NADH:flavin oxidoreductase/NADH oxidase family protein [Acinetobacter sp. S54]